MSAGAGRGLARRPEEGEALWVIGGLYTYRSVGADNDNAYTLSEVTGPPGLATPHHIHQGEDEGFYVVSGEVSFVIGDQTVNARAGSFALAPRGVPHAFRLESPGTKLLLLITPGAAGHEGLFREMGQPAERREIPTEQAPPDFARMAETAERHGTRIVGPPPVH
jgi:quercetin dioxygenase-like cupin family protein